MSDPMHDRLLAIVHKLPGAHEDWPWGSLHCKVDGKIFAGWGRDEQGDMVLGIRVDRDLQGMLVASDPRFTIAKYVGKYGGVDMNLGKQPNWREVEQFIVGSYRIIASNKRVKELDGRTEAGTVPKKAVKKAAKKTAKKAVKNAAKTAAKKTAKTTAKTAAKTAAKKAAKTTAKTAAKTTAKTAAKSAAA